MSLPLQLRLKLVVRRNRSSLKGKNDMKIKILIVEDFRYLADEIGRILEEAGYETFVLKEFTKEKIQAGLNFKPNIVLLDHGLIKDLTGEDIAKSLQLASDHLISISTGNFDTSYCKYSFVYKDGLLYPGRSADTAKQLLETIEYILLLNNNNELKQ
jgi:DNA-binding NtrC family response regulator